MHHNSSTFCRRYRPIGALILLLLILFRGCNTPAPPPLTVAPVAQATAVPPTVAPTAAPTATPLALPTLNAFAEGDLTADGVRLGGTGQPGAILEVWDGSTKVGVAVVGAGGKWTMSASLSEGPHKLAVRTVDASGRVLNESAATDLTVPASVAMPTLDTPAAADFAAEGVRLGGTGHPGATVEVWDGSTKVSAAVVGTDGKWALTAKLGEGPRKLAVRALNPASKTFSEAPAIDVTVPLHVALPTLNAPAEGDVTADRAKLSGTGQPGATVQVWDGATRVGTAVVGVDAKWTMTVKLSEGSHKLSVRTVDASGKTLNESAAVEVTVPQAEDPGESYIVRSGDWLTRLAQTYYGDPNQYRLIVEATNARAATDPSYAKISDSNRIYPGQKLWIPPRSVGQ